MPQAPHSIGAYDIRRQHGTKERGNCLPDRYVFALDAVRQEQGKAAMDAEGCKAFLPGITEGWETLEQVAEEEGLI